MSVELYDILQVIYSITNFFWKSLDVDRTILRPLTWCCGSEIISAFGPISGFGGGRWCGMQALPVHIPIMWKSMNVSCQSKYCILDTVLWGRWSVHLWWKDFIWCQMANNDGSSYNKQHGGQLDHHPNVHEFEFSAAGTGPNAAGTSTGRNLAVGVTKCVLNTSVPFQSRCKTNFVDNRQVNFGCRYVSLLHHPLEVITLVRFSGCQ